MSRLKTHAIQGAVATAALYPVIGGHAITFGLATVFIDVDHVFEYVRDTKSCDVRGLFTYCNLIEENLDKNFLVLSTFHTIEFFILMLCLSSLYPGLAYVVAGMALHMVTDLYHISVTLRRPFARAFSLVEYIYKSRTDNYLTSVKELVQQDHLNGNSTRNVQHWLRKWNLLGKP
jgi:hypothetical protein